MLMINHIEKMTKKNQRNELNKIQNSKYIVLDYITIFYWINNIKYYNILLTYIVYI